MKQRPRVNFSEEISVRTKVNANMTVTITVMNHTTMDTMVGIFNFRDIITKKDVTDSDDAKLVAPVSNSSFDTNDEQACDGQSNPEEATAEEADEVESEEVQDND